MSVELSFNRNDATHDGVYAESIYALEASGGFTMERKFADIKQYVQTEPVHVDVTNAVQIMMNVETINAKLGEYNSDADSFANNYISISSADLVSGVTKGAQVISVGKYSELYSDFKNYVANYFDYMGGLSNLFSGVTDFAIDVSNQFTGESFVRLLNKESDEENGKSINGISGSISIGYITEILRNVVDTNVFGNRNPETKKWSVSDGFVDGDLIWVPTGTTITLKLSIDGDIIQMSYDGDTETDSNSEYSSSTNDKSTLLSRTLSAPLLIKLVSSSKINDL
jgi:hypothetical protein